MKLKPQTGKMNIPAPEYNEDSVTFYPIVKVGFWEPYGYREDPEDKQLLQPITRELLALEEAKKHLSKGFSLRDVSSWLSAQTGRYISHQGLKERVAADKTKSRDYYNAKYIAQQLAFAYKKARKLEATWLGEIEPSNSTIRRELLEIAGETSED